MNGSPTGSPTEGYVYRTTMWRVRWSTPDEERKYHTAYVAAPSFSSAARLAQDEVARTVKNGEWPEVSLEPEGDVLYEIP